MSRVELREIEHSRFEQLALHPCLYYNERFH